MKTTFKNLVAVCGLFLLASAPFGSCTTDDQSAIRPNEKDGEAVAEEGNGNGPLMPGHADTMPTAPALEEALAAEHDFPMAAAPEPTSAAEREVLYDGEIMVYAPDEMTEHEEGLVVAVIAIDLDEEEVIGHISGSTGRRESDVQADSRLFGATLSDSLRVSLEFDPEDFKLTSETSSYYLYFDKARKPYFTWEVEPQSPGLKKLTVKLENYVDHSWNRYALPQIIEIDVKVNTKTFFIRMWDKLQNDPSWSLDHILLPILAFIGGLFATAIKNKLKRKKE